MIFRKGMRVKFKIGGSKKDVYTIFEGLYNGHRCLMINAETNNCCVLWYFEGGKTGWTDCFVPAGPKLKRKALSTKS